MTLTRTIRRFVCQLMAAVLLFAQLAVAAYACSGALRGTDGVRAMATQMASTQASQMSHCEQMAPSSKALCIEHCHGGQQSPDTASAPSVQPALPLLLYVLPLQSDAQPLALMAAAAPLRCATATPPPPHAILHCVLRI